GGLGIPQMDTPGKEAHFGALDVQRAEHFPPFHLGPVHTAHAPAVRGNIAARPSGRIRSTPVRSMPSPRLHLTHSSVPRRTDRTPMHARTGSYVIPADVVSGLGQGNTYAGAKMWGQAIAHSAGPYGTTNTIRPGHMRAPSLHMGRGK